jgi:hypothetical protein
MPDISEPEARILLSQPLRCEDAPDWKNAGVQVGTSVLRSGLVDPMGVATGLYLELLYIPRPRALLVSYRFSVFRRNRCDVERVYQLTVNQSASPIKDKHRQSHEHLGASRHTGKASWQNWSYDEVFAYFCARTNITFNPVPAHPERFRNKG